MSNLNKIKKLMNQSVDYKKIQNENKALVQKWQKYGLLDGLNQQQSQTMARLLNNQALNMLSQGTLTGNQAGSEQWNGIALPLVRKVIASIPSKEFVSVQPMDRPSGLVFYIDYKYGNTKLPYTKGDSVYGTTSGKDSPYGGFYGAGRFSYSVNTKNEAFASVQTGSLSSGSYNFDTRINTTGLKTLTMDLSSKTIAIDENAINSFAITVKSGSKSTIKEYYPEFTKYDSTSKKLTFVIQPDTDYADADQFKLYYSTQPANAHSRGDFEFRGSDGFTIPELDIGFKSQGIVAKTRKLKASWTPQASYSMKSYQQVDVEQEITDMLSTHITTQIDLEILSMLINNVDTVGHWSAIPGKEYNSTTNAFEDVTSYNIIDKSMWFRTLGIKVQDVSNSIHQKTMRGGANFMVVSPKVATIVQSMNGFSSDFDGKDGMGNISIGVQKIGSIDKRITVWVNPYTVSNVALLGYRGNSFLETGAVYAPYIPFIATPVIFDPVTLTPNKGIMSMYAKKMIRNEFYGAIVIHGLETL